MSGIAAIIRFDGQSADPQALAKMTDAMSYRGPDGIAHWHRGNVALGHCLLRTTTESLEEVQPLLSEDGALALVMDGYLANYDELRSDLLSRGATLRTRSDVELVLRAYETWGEECPIRLEGEFTFLLWNERQQQVFIVRDHAGMRPLHYVWDGKCLIVASDIAGVLANSEVPRRPNLGMIAENMANEWFSQTETVWDSVVRLEPARWMRVSASGARTGCYWEPPQEVVIHYARDEDYFEHYLHVLQDSVRCASRTHLPLGCEVSGGLDSSAVFAIADDLLRSGTLRADDLKGYTYHFPVGSEPDEIQYARAVAAHTGREVREIAPFMPDLDWFIKRGRADDDLVPCANLAFAINIGKAATAEGCRVVLNGEGGDEFLTGKSHHYHEDMVNGDWKAVARSLRADLKDRGLAQTIWRFARFGIAPMAPRPILDIRHRLTPKRGPNHFDSAFWMTGAQEAFLKQRRAAVDRDRICAITNRPRRAMTMGMTEPYLVGGRGIVARQAAQGGYELRSPMYSRQFVEFAFSIPEHMRLRGATKKFGRLSHLHT